MKKAPTFALLMCLVLALSAGLRADDAVTATLAEAGKLPVFFDYAGPEKKALQEQVSFARFVTDREEAQVEIRLEPVAGPEGEQRFRLTFSGRKDLAGLTDTIEPRFSGQLTEAERIDQLGRTLKQGLVNYAAKTDLAPRIDISLDEQTDAAQVKDKWNFWVFSLSADAYFDGEKSYRKGSLSANLSANRITPQFKTRMSVSLSRSQDYYEYQDEIIETRQDSASFSGLWVKSFGEHWSVGGYADFLSSTYYNILREFDISPAVEYNVFPYSRSTEKQFRFLYKIGIQVRRYHEETIFGKTAENLWRESLAATLELKRKWGTVRTSIEGAHYFHDFSKNQVNLSASIDLRLVKGLTLYLFGGGTMIHDQMGLPAGDATLEEVLLQRKQLKTDYDYFLITGVSFTFGSVNSKVVNPRFGATNTGGARISMN